MVDVSTFDGPGGGLRWYKPQAIARVRGAGVLGSWGRKGGGGLVHACGVCVRTIPVIGLRNANLSLHDLGYGYSGHTYRSVRVSRHESTVASETTGPRFVQVHGSCRKQLSVQGRRGQLSAADAAALRLV